MNQYSLFLKSKQISRTNTDLNFSKMYVSNIQTNTVFLPGLKVISSMRNNKLKLENIIHFKLQAKSKRNCTQ